jgi:hypothetical protein
MKQYADCLKLWSAFVVIAILIVTPVQLESQNKFIAMESRIFPGGFKEDGMWTALSAASDGKIYVGLSTSGNSAHFYIYDPGKDELIHRADIAKELGESGKGIRTSGKIHTPFVEDANGRIYFASGGAGPGKVDRRSFAGGHWFRYDPGKDDLEDLGIILPGQGLYALVIDKNRNLLYGTTNQGHFVIFDIDGRRTFDKGKINNQGNVGRYLVIDDEGVVYGNHDANKIFRYKPQEEKIEEMSIEIPADKSVMPGRSLNFNYFWRVALWDKNRKSIYGIDRLSSTLSRYDPYKGQEGEIKPLLQLCALPYLGARTMPRATLALTMGKDDKIYYVPVSQPFDYSEKLNFIKSKLTGKNNYSHLVTYDLVTGKREHHGIIRVEEDLRLLGVGGATTGLDGTIYFCGAVEINNLERNAGKVGGRVPFELRLIIHHIEELNFTGDSN